MDRGMKSMAALVKAHPYGERLFESLHAAMIMACVRTLQRASPSPSCHLTPFTAQTAGHTQSVPGAAQELTFSQAPVLDKKDKQGSKLNPFNWFKKDM